MARVYEHNAGVSTKAFTYKRRPVELLGCWPFERIDEAIAFERQVKGWSRAKKLALLTEDWDRLRALSRRGGVRGGNASS